MTYRLKITLMDSERKKLKPREPEYEGARDPGGRTEQQKYLNFPNS